MDFAIQMEGIILVHYLNVVLLVHQIVLLFVMASNAHQNLIAFQGFVILIQFLLIALLKNALLNQTSVNIIKIKLLIVLELNVILILTVTVVIAMKIMN